MGILWLDLLLNHKNHDREVSEYANALRRANKYDGTHKPGGTWLFGALLKLMYNDVDSDTGAWGRELGKSYADRREKWDENHYKIRPWENVLEEWRTKEKARRGGLASGSVQNSDYSYRKAA